MFEYMVYGAQINTHAHSTFIIELLCMFLEIRGFHVRGTYTHPENFLEATLSTRNAISFCPQTTHIHNTYTYILTLYLYQLWVNRFCGSYILSLVRT